MNVSYWLKQSPTEPLFPDVEWSRPEQRAHAGKLAIIGGNKLGFVAVRDAYETAASLGAGQIRAILPDILKRSVPTSVSDALFLASNPSGGFSRDALPEFHAACAWADLCLLIGDAGRNSETAMAFESLVNETRRLVVTRDAVDDARTVVRSAAKAVPKRLLPTHAEFFDAAHAASRCPAQIHHHVSGYSRHLPPKPVDRRAWRPGQHDGIRRADGYLAGRHRDTGSMLLAVESPKAV